MSEEQKEISARDKRNRFLGERIFGSIDEINAQLPKGIAYTIPESFYDDALKDDDGDTEELDINILKRRYFLAHLRSELYALTYNKVAKNVSGIIMVVAVLTCVVSFSWGFYLEKHSNVVDVQQPPQVMSEQEQAKSMLEKLLGKQQ